jgi:DNA/RNA-binding domain of Phe-tRNA-synthetase-like protein
MNNDELVLALDVTDAQLDMRAFVTEFPRPIGEVETPAEVLDLLRPDAKSPFGEGDDVVSAVRELLRRGGFKPSGRSKPASEYLRKAAAEGIKPINVAVDVCNAASLHSGLPISVVDLDRAAPPLQIRVAPPGSSYIFNLSGQVIELAGLLCLCDASGPCASPVKDSQRTKTDSTTRQTVTIIWGTRSLPGRATQAEEWYRRILERLGAQTQTVPTHLAAH